MLSYNIEVTEMFSQLCTEPSWDYHCVLRVWSVYMLSAPGSNITPSIPSLPPGHSILLEHGLQSCQLAQTRLLLSPLPLPLYATSTSVTISALLEDCKTNTFYHLTSWLGHAGNFKLQLRNSQAGDLWFYHLTTQILTKETVKKWTV